MSRASRLIEVERSDASCDFSILNQAFSSILCFATSKHHVLVSVFVGPNLAKKLFFYQYLPLTMAQMAKYGTEGQAKNIIACTIFV